MRPAALLELLFVAYVLVLLPWAAFVSSRRLDPARGTAGHEPPTTEQVLVSTLLSLVVLLVFAWVTAAVTGAELFRLPPFDARVAALAAAAFGLHLGFLWLSRVVRSEAERRASKARAFMPRTPRQWALYAAVCVLAGAAEEAAYRGVAVQVLAPRIGLPAAILLSATAFAVSHALQGWKSAAIVLAMALVMHALVQTTGSLVPAMAVHAVYDLIAGLAYSRQVRRWDAEDALAAQRSGS